MEEDEEKLEEAVKLMENHLKAKKAILQEVLETVETEKDKKTSTKRRKYIRDILNCEVTFPSTVNDIFSIDPIDSFRFEHHVVARFSIRSHVAEGDLLITVTSCSSSVRWILFDTESSTEPCSVIGSNNSGILCVAIPFSDLFQDDKLRLNIHGKITKKKIKIFTFNFYSIIEKNQSAEAPQEAVTSASLSLSEASEEFDLRSIEFMDEKKAIRIVQSIFLLFSQLEIENAAFEFSTFRRHFPGFLENDFDTWRLYVGTDRFDGVLVYTKTEDDSTKNLVIGKTASTCFKFMNALNAKC
ncbi:Protein CBG18390 [Caenorhabditis briggsae]|uniref:Uncharacterized protein n=2 Tax=Caenorhabditis briggsae TaxID=6238 RepID=A0AAE9INK2_CAEBR|nr:Protein CBG18390 [Caenorhabditis briggsae]ULT99884.1 hypothetical protein L3Y34_000863 [Caenorhabditis briggsae]CAP35856.1 Protein CBG18390 [Caenorhabditis briggsae]